MGMKFLRRDWNRHPKLGKKRKNKQVWRRPKGRDNKMREKRKGYPKVVKPGYEKEKSVKGKINGKEPVTITKVSELDWAEEKKEKIAVLGKVGKKRKMEISKKAQEKGIEFSNLNPKKYLKQAKFENKKKKEAKDARTAKKKAREEKAKSSKKEKDNKKENSEKFSGSNEEKKENKKTEDKSQKPSGSNEEKKENKKPTTKSDSESNKTSQNK